MPRMILCGDVMTGRGVDQILPQPGDPALDETTMHDARGYVALAETANGPIPRPVSFSYPWGAALSDAAWLDADARIVNLETSITRSNTRFPGKPVLYRMSPDNVGCLTAARIDVCALANNHVLDYGHAGLIETIEALGRTGMQCAGAGRRDTEARRPAVVGLGEAGRILVFAMGTETSGIPRRWAAAGDRAGVDLVRLTPRTTADLADRIQRVKRERDVVVASIHWGPNWGFSVTPGDVRFAHGLVEAGVDVVHGHSSHHVRPIEVHRGRLILYGCGAFIDDYEGISGYEEFRGDLVVAYAVKLGGRGELMELRMMPLRVRKMRLERASSDDTLWLHETLSRTSETFGTRFGIASDGALMLRID